MCHATVIKTECHEVPPSVRTSGAPRAWRNSTREWKPPDGRSLKDYSPPNCRRDPHPRTPEHNDYIADPEEPHAEPDRPLLVGTLARASTSLLSSGDRPRFSQMGPKQQVHLRKIMLKMILPKSIIIFGSIIKSIHRLGFKEPTPNTKSFHSCRCPERKEQRQVLGKHLPLTAYFTTPS